MAPDSDRRVPRQPRHAVEVAVIRAICCDPNLCPAKRQRRCGVTEPTHSRRKQTIQEDRDE